MVQTIRERMGLKNPSVVAAEIRFWEEVNHRYEVALVRQQRIDGVDEGFPIGRAEIPSPRTRDKGVTQLINAYTNVITEVATEIGFQLEDVDKLKVILEADSPAYDPSNGDYTGTDDPSSIEYLQSNGLYREWLLHLFGGDDSHAEIASVSYAGFCVEMAIKSVISAVSKTKRGWELVGLPHSSVAAVLQFKQDIYEMDVYPTEQQYIGKALIDIPGIWDAVNYVLKQYSMAVRYEWDRQKENGEEWDESPLPDDDLPVTGREYRLERAIAEVAVGSPVGDVAKKHQIRKSDLLAEAQRRNLVKRRRPRKMAA